MAENVLEKIIKKKSERIVNLKKTISLESLDELINTNKEASATSLADWTSENFQKGYKFSRATLTDSKT